MSTYQYVCATSFSECHSLWTKAVNTKSLLKSHHVALIVLVEDAMELGMFSYRLITERIESEQPSFFPPNKDNGVCGGSNQSEVTGVVKYLNATKASTIQSNATKILISHIGIGTKLGIITPNDGKQLRGAIVETVGEESWFHIIGTRGRNRYRVSLDSVGLIRAIKRGQPNSPLANILSSHTN